MPCTSGSGGVDVSTLVEVLDWKKTGIKGPKLSVV